MVDLSAPLAVAVEAARQAGALLRADFHQPGGARGSGGHAPADTEAETLIRQQLLAAYPWNYRGEELGYTDNGHAEMTWLVDPNDGTSAYLKGFRGSAVSIAALRSGVPVLGVVFAFGFPDDDGDMIAWAEGCPFTRNGQTQTAGPPLPWPKNNDGSPVIVFVSQDADKRAEANTLCVQPARYISIPSIAYRLARVAAGDGAAAVSLAGPVGWDYAAGHALLRAAGGNLVDASGVEVTYSHDGQSHVPFSCFGGSPPAVAVLRTREWANLLNAAAARPANNHYGLCRPQRGRAVADAAMLSRAQGCLLGQLAGDALGGLTEFQTVKEIRRSYPNGVRELRDGGTWGNLAGQPTDDSEMALMLARSIVAQGHYDRAAALSAYVHWWPRAWDRGNTITQAVGAASRGKDAHESLRLAEESASRTSQSNGGLMRISPLAIFASGRLDQAIGLARDECRLTHPHPVCQDACAAYVAAVSTAIANGGTPREIHAAALHAARQNAFQPAVVAALENAAHARPADYHSQMGWVLIALQNSFFQLLNAPNLEEGVADTVIQGGDTDTNAAIAGALLGAVHGRPAVPHCWILALLSCRTLPSTPTRHPQPPEYWPVDALQLAEALLCAGRSDH